MDASSPAIWVAAAVPPVEVQDAGSALMLWLLLAAGLAAFLIAVVVVTVSRRSRSAAKRQQATSDLDAWKAAAERISTPVPPEEE